jgi:hypothetical protein
MKSLKSSLDLKKLAMKKFLHVLALIIFLFSLPILTLAQNPQDSIKSRVETLDGNEYIGIIQEQTPDKIRLKTEKLGEISIPVVDIKRITRLDAVQLSDGTYWLDNPQATRYFWSPNSYNLKKGEGYYQNVWILFNQAVYGLTDHLSAGVGVVPLFLFAGASTPAWITAKFSIPVVENKFNIGAGGLVGTVIGEENTGFGILYGISTFGSKDQNFNIGLGWGFAGGEMAKNPTVNVGAMLRTGPKGYFITENYFIGTPDEFVVMMMVGGRRIIKRTGLDYGVVIPIAEDMGGFIAVPWLGLTIPF